MKERRLTLIAPNRPFDLVFFGLILAGTVILSIAGIVSDLLTAMAFLTVFFIPGYAMQAAIFPAGRIWGGNKKVPDGLERLAISLILSFLVTALTTTLLAGGLGFVLVDISKDMVISIVLMVTALASFAAVDRRLKVPKERAFNLVLVIKPIALNRSEKLFAVLAVLLVAAAGVNTVIQLNNPVKKTPFTTFAIYGPSGDVGSLPNNLVAGNGTSLIMFIECGENRATQYNLTVWLNDSTPSALLPLDLGNITSLENGTRYFLNIDLADGEIWTRTLEFSVPVPGVHQLLLNLEASGEPSKQLWLWVSVN